MPVRRVWVPRPSPLFSDRVAPEKLRRQVAHFAAHTGADAAERLATVLTAAELAGLAPGELNRIVETAVARNDAGERFLLDAWLSGVPVVLECLTHGRARLLDDLRNAATGVSLGAPGSATRLFSWTNTVRVPFTPGDGLASPHPAPPNLGPFQRERFPVDEWVAECPTLDLTPERGGLADAFPGREYAITQAELRAEQLHPLAGRTSFWFTDALSMLHLVPGVFNVYHAAVPEVVARRRTSGVLPLS